MSGVRRDNRRRSARAVRALWGAALLAVPGPVIDSVGGPADPATLIVVRVLGLRHLVQSALCGADDRRRKGAVVDLVHALSMAALAAGARRHRRLAATDACVALAFAGSGLRLRHRSDDPITAAVEATVPGDRPGHGRLPSHAHASHSRAIGRGLGGRLHATTAYPLNCR